MMQLRYKVLPDFVTALALITALLCLSVPTALAGDRTATPNTHESADTIYQNGEILTMEGSQPHYVDAVAVKNGVIQVAGSLNRIAHYQGKSTKIVDLQGKLMMPSFLDPHSHFSFAFNLINQVNVGSPPMGPITDIPSLLSQLKQYQQAHHIPKHGWIIGWAYDQTQLKEHRHILKSELDAVFPDNKVALVHVSGHLAVLNSQALAWANIDKNTVAPPASLIGRVPNSEALSGLVTESVYFPLYQKLPKPSLKERLAATDRIQQMYASEGYTRAVEGAAEIRDILFLKAAADQHKLYLDVIATPVAYDESNWGKLAWITYGHYKNNLKFKGIKVIQDGSPQAKTAYMSTPYLTGGLNGEKHWFGGGSLMSQEKLDALVHDMVQKNRQVFVHANGDTAIDQVIHAVKKSGITAKDDRRTTIIHSQFQRKDQLAQYKKLGITPSYFTNHVYFWGDEHIKNKGKTVADFISPIQAAVDLGIPFSDHTDFNVTPLNSRLVMWTAMSRTTKNHKVLGRDQRVNAYTALQGLTTGPAYQMFEEKQKGKIKAGYEANFIILDKNPTKVALYEIKAIKILQTIKADHVIFALPETS